MRTWALCGNFFRECRREFRTTGSILPSSRFLAKALVSELKRARPPATVLEVGPGTGSVTTAILRQLQPTDHVDLVEINETFIGVLKKRLGQDRLFKKHKDQIRLIHAAVQDLPGEASYDYIVSCLPFNNFPANLVRRIFRTYERLLKPGGVLSYYEYVLVRKLKSPFVSKRERQRLRCLERVVGGYIKGHEFRHQPILANIPPAIVRHLRFGAPFAKSR
jgi:phosphatidylethanolamine/phosphatidyl-N-methylethanolamine N-methyltransferase